MELGYKDSIHMDATPDGPVPPETRIGHFHLFISNLEETRHFYHDLLGFDIMGLAKSFQMGMVSTGGYHHHIGFNAWQGEGAPPPPPSSYVEVLPIGIRSSSMQDHV
jgi:catechol 2,3-dioxygenase